MAPNFTIGNLKIQNVNGGRIGFNRNTANGDIYDSNFAAFQINGAYSGADFMAFEAYTSGGVGTDAMVIKDNGNVGIGNTNPNLPLTVTSNGGANAIAIRARSADDYGFMQFYNHAGDTVRGQVYSHSTGNAVGISTGNSSSNGIRIDTDGLHFQKRNYWGINRIPKK